jgi:predicted nucleic acid-binding protein
LSFLLDTNVISELRRPTPSPAVLRWFNQFPEDQLSICVLTLGEIQSGISRLSAGSKKADLLLWFDHLKDSFRNQIYSIDEMAALKWGELSAKASVSGKPMPIIDGLIAACALVNSATLVTRNVKEFEGTDVELFNPWEY